MWRKLTVFMLAIFIIFSMVGCFGVPQTSYQDEGTSQESYMNDENSSDNNSDYSSEQSGGQTSGSEESSGESGNEEQASTDPYHEKMQEMARWEVVKKAITVADVYKPLFDIATEELGKFPFDKFSKTFMGVNINFETGYDTDLTQVIQTIADKLKEKGYNVQVQGNNLMVVIDDAHAFIIQGSGIQMTYNKDEAKEFTFDFSKMSGSKHWDDIKHFLDSLSLPEDGDVVYNFTVDLNEISFEVNLAYMMEKDKVKKFYEEAKSMLTDTDMEVEMAGVKTIEGKYKGMKVTLSITTNAPGGSNMNLFGVDILTSP